LIGLGILAAIFMGLWQFDRLAHQYLRDELGHHLRDLAVSVAATVPGDSLLFWSFEANDPAWSTPVALSLARIRQDNDLANIFVCLPNNDVLLDVSHTLPSGSEHPFLVMDLAEVEAARSGIASASKLYHPVEGAYLMTGYAPVFDSYGEVAGFVGVEASVGFFDTLGDLRGTIVAIGVTVMTLVSLLVILYLFYARRLAKARAALDRSETLSTMGRMAAGIAHEIRNPLGIIKNTAQLLKEDLDEQGIRTEMVDFIPEEVDRLNEILSGYLDFAREAPARMAEVELDQLIRRTFRLMEQDFAAAGVEVTHNLDDTARVNLVADARRLQQVFLNLFLNALQAMPQGGSLQLTLFHRDGVVEVRVVDTGVGLSADDARHAFDPFVTSKDKGSGLGLNIVRRIVVEDHGGEVSIDGQRGQGATIVVRLPMRQ